MTSEDLAHLRRAHDQMDRDYACRRVVRGLARTALLSPALFSRQFKLAYGESPYGYLMTRRIERAKALLRRGDLSVTEVCMAVGCTSLGSFSLTSTAQTIANATNINGKSIKLTASATSTNPAGLGGAA